MKVLMLSGDLNIFYNSYSPAANRMREYGAAFGVADIILFLRDEGGRDIELSPSARVYMVSGRVMRFVKGFIRGVALIHKNRYEVVVAQDVEHAAIAWLLSLLYKISWQMQIHTDIFNRYFWDGSFTNKLRTILAKFLLKRASRIRVVSGRIKKSLAAYGIQPAAITVLPIFVDVEKIKSAPIATDLHKKYPQFDFIILMASRLTREKNIGLALEAMAEFQESNPKSLLLIVGDGPEKENLKIKISELKVNDNVIFETWSEDLISYYKTCDLFLLTSNYEGYGMTLIEAAAAGAKIISSDVGVAPEILEAENIFKVGDKNDLISKLKNAIAGSIKPPKSIPQQTKEEYLRLYKESLESAVYER